MKDRVITLNWHSTFVEESRAMWNQWTEHRDSGGGSCGFTFAGGFLGHFWQMTLSLLASVSPQEWQCSLFLWSVWIYINIELYLKGQFALLSFSKEMCPENHKNFSLPTKKRMQRQQEMSKSNITHSAVWGRCLHQDSLVCLFLSLLWVNWSSYLL